MGNIFALTPNIGVWSKLIEFIYPSLCPACDEPCGAGLGLCETCGQSLYPLGPACRRCALPLTYPTDGCGHCGKLRLDRAFAAYRYGGELGLALRRLKYHRRPDIARTLGPLIRPALSDALAQVDVVVPVPLHFLRLLRQGFNHAERLLHHARPAGAPGIDTKSLRRIRKTRSQAGLDAAARKTNLRAAFRVRARRTARISGKTILLFDDVMSTGATLSAAARALKQAGARQVFGFAVARAE